MKDPRIRPLEVVISNISKSDEGRNHSATGWDIWENEDSEEILDSISVKLGKGRKECLEDNSGWKEGFSTLIWEKLVVFLVGAGGWNGDIETYFS